MKKRDLMKEIKSIAYEYQTEILRIKTNLDTDTKAYVFYKLMDIYCEISNSTKIKTKEKIEKLLNFIELTIKNNPPIRPLIDLKNKLYGVKKFIWTYQLELKA